MSGSECGQTTVEYLAVLLGLILAWLGTEAVLMMLNEHQGELGWALSLPL